MGFFRSLHQRNLIGEIFALGLCGVSFSPLFARAESIAEFYNPAQVDTQKYDTQQPINHIPGAFMTGTQFKADSQSPLYKYCSATPSGQTYYCFSRVTVGSWSVDPTVFPGKRVWAATAPYIYTRAGCFRRTGTYFPPSAPMKPDDRYDGPTKYDGHAKEDCGGTFNSLNTDNSLRATGYFCPLGSQYRGTNGFTDPEKECGHTNPYTLCKPGVRDELGYDCSAGEPYPGYTFKNCQYRMYGSCSETQFKSYQSAYNECISPIQKENQVNASKGAKDCFCSHVDGDGVPDYSFMFLGGSWKCMRCGEGMKQRESTGVGCESRCGPNQQWISTTKSCKTCQEGEEAIHAKCLPKCETGKVRDMITLGCKAVCPSGMNTVEAGQDILGNKLYKCNCLDTRFETGSFRIPSKPTSITGLPIPGWRYEANITSDDSQAGCVCGTGSNNASLFDQAFAVVPAAGANFLPYGMVPLNSVNSGKLVCGCPNFNEQFQLDAATGQYRCVPQLKGPKEAVALAPISDVLDLPKSGVIVDKSNFPAQTTAYLRGISDMSETYSRKVWKCRPGYYLNAGTCTLIDDAIADRFACSDDNAQFTKSSVLNEFVKISLTPPDGVLAGKNFDKLTNRRMACCTGTGLDLFGNPKPDCPASNPADYEKKGGFDAFYDEQGGNNAYAKVTKPNRVYLVDAAGNKVTGIFRRDGTRCNITAAGPSAEMEIFSEIAKRAKATPADPLGGPLTVAAFGGAANVDKRCTTVVRTALEVACMEDTADINGTTILNSIVIGGVRRCIGLPASMTIHYDIMDASNPSETHRGVFKNINSTENGSLAAPVDMQRFILGK
jgi:hypothetical protein